MGSLHQFLFKPLAKTPRSRLFFWIGLSLLIAAVCPTIALEKAFSQAFVMQDDARQHVFWMSRFVDPELFPGDTVADYFQSVAPWGYTSLYRLFATIGVSPILLHKLLPIALVFISTLYAFGVCLKLLLIPFAGFLATVLLNQALWMRDDIVSATPVAFVYPIFLAFLYYLLQRQLIPCLIAIVLQGLFYPQCVFVYALVLLLRLLSWHEGRLTLSTDRRNLWFGGAGLGVAVLVMLPYALKSSEFGPVTTLAEARSLFTFSEAGWSAFFAERWHEFWLCGKRSGMLPTEWCTASSTLLPSPDSLQPNPLRAFLLPQVWFAIALPLVLHRSARLPLAQQVTRDVMVLPQVLIASVSCFFLAHALLFRLHLPNRYTEHSFRIILALAAALTVTILLEVLLSGLSGQANKPTSNKPISSKPISSTSREKAKEKANSSHLRTTQRSVFGRVLLPGIGLALMVLIVVSPTVLQFDGQRFPVLQYARGRFPELYQYLADQPKDIVIASLDREVNNLPSFTQRSILTGTDGFILPYHQGYYQAMNQRITDLIAAQYSPDLSQVQQFIQQYGVDFWLLRDTAFQPSELRENRVFVEYEPATKGIQRQLRGNSAPPALADLQTTCAALQTEVFTVLETACILQQTDLIARSPNK
jgi:hypothetical protein